MANYSTTMNINQNIKIHYTKSKLDVQDVEDEEVINQITSVKSYLETMRKNPGGLNFAVTSHNKYSRNKSSASAEFNNTKNTILLAKSNIRCREDDTSSSSTVLNKEHLTNMRQTYDDSLSNCTPGISTKSNNSNSNITTMTTSVKPTRISSSIRDIQGMLVSNLNSTTTYGNYHSGANFALSNSLSRRVDLEYLPNHTAEYLCKNLSSVETTATNIQKLDATGSITNVFQNCGDSLALNQSSASVTGSLASGEAFGMVDNLNCKTQINRATTDIVNLGAHYSNSGTESTTTASTLSLSSSATSDKMSSPDTTRRMTDGLEAIVTLEKCQKQGLQLASDPSSSLVSNNFSYHDSAGMPLYHSTSSDEINSCNSSDNCNIATSCSKKVRRVVKRVNPNSKGIDKKERGILFNVDQSQCQYGEYIR